MAMTLGELAKHIGGTLHGDPSNEITACAPIEHAGPGTVTFLANVKYAKHLQDTKAAAVILGDGILVPDGIARIVADDPYFAFRNAAVALHGFRKHPPVVGPLSGDATLRVANHDAERRGNADGQISAAASIHPDAKVGPGTTVHPNVVIERGAVVGSNCVLYPGVYIGVDAKVGDACILHPNVSIYDGCVLGNRIILHASTVIGQDGFGYATHGGVHHKIPQTGIVVIEDDVEMGAGCAIERAALGETRIGKGTKFADLISIGHGSKIGAHCLFVSLVGVSGSVEVGNYVVLGGQVGVTGHLKIGHGVQAMARSAIIRDVPDGQKIGGIPAVPADLARRNALAGLELYELSKRVRQLERELEAIRGQRSEVGGQSGGGRGGRGGRK